MTYQLICQKQDSLEAEFAIAEVEEVLKRGAEEIDDHCIIIAFGSEPANERNTDTTCKSLVDLGLVLELGVLGLDGFELDGHFLAGDDVDSEVDVPCGGNVRHHKHRTRYACTHRKSPNRFSSPGGTFRRLAGPAFRARMGLTL